MTCSVCCAHKIQSHSAIYEACCAVVGSHCHRSEITPTSWGRSLVLLATAGMSAAPVSILLVSLLCCCNLAASQTALNVTVNSQGYLNYFLRQNDISTVTLASASPGITQRILVATPAGNAGAVAYFNATNRANSFRMAVVNGSLHSIQQGNNSGVAGTITFNQNATLTRAIVGSVRAMRDFVEGNGLTHDVFNHTTTKAGPSVHLSHVYINGTNSVNLTFTPTSTECTLSVLPDGNFTVNLAAGVAVGSVNFTWLGSEEQLPGYSSAELHPRKLLSQYI